MWGKAQGVTRARVPDDEDGVGRQGLGADGTGVEDVLHAGQQGVGGGEQGEEERAGVVDEVDVPPAGQQDAQPLQQQDAAQGVVFEGPHVLHRRGEQ